MTRFSPRRPTHPNAVARPLLCAPAGVSVVRGIVGISLAVMLGACGKDDTSAHTGTHTGTHETEPTAAEWFQVAEHAGSGFLSMWGYNENDLWVVGSDAGSGPALYHYDGAAWSKKDTGSSGTLWWIWGSDDKLMMSGDAGRVVTHDIAAGTFTEEVLNPSITFFGIWGSSETDVWAVGGDSFSSSNAQLWHYDGAAWAQWTDVPVEFEDLFQGFKVWGSGPNDVWVVGSNMFTMHWDGASWTYVAPPGAEKTTRSLFTVNGDGAGNVFAVGGVGDGTILRWDGAAWVDESPAGAPQFNGTFTRAGSETVACGVTGTLYRRDSSSGTWTEDERGSASPLDFHGCYVDPNGGVYGVGGYLNAAPQVDGFIVYAGDSPPAAL